jgi:glycosyltransferase involved in cell wall biosynthesis
VSEPGGQPRVDVSVVIPAYNAARYLTETVESVLRQTFPWLECIIVDDASTDATAEIAGSFLDPRVRYLRVEHGGVARARNAGMRAAQGEWVALLDADDVWLPHKLDRQLSAARSSPDAGLVLCGYYVSSQTLEPEYRVVPRGSRWAIDDWMLLQGNGPAMGSTALLLRSLVLEVGEFADELTTSADLDFAHRLAGAASVVTVQQPLVHYRTHGEQMHLDAQAFEADMRQVFETTLSLDPIRRRRGEANLHTRLFYAAGRRRDAAAMRRHLREVMTREPRRLLVLPLSVLGRKARQRAGALVDRRNLTARGERPGADEPSD